MAKASPVKIYIFNAIVQGFIAHLNFQYENIARKAYSVFCVKRSVLFEFNSEMTDLHISFPQY